MKDSVKSKYIPVLLLLLCICIQLSQTGAQESKAREAQKIFFSIEEGLSSGAIDKFSSHFGNRNYLSLLNGTTSYFSANQSYYVIKDFLSINQPVSFKFTNVVTENATPFASGILKYNSKGIRGTALVFISLQLHDNKWFISQITIN